MSDESRTEPPQEPSPGTPAGPQPESLRFFGTSWVGHTDRYGLRRVGVAVGSLVAAVAGCLVLRFAYQGLEIADVGSFVNVLVVIMFAICSAVAFRRTWEGFGKRHDPQSVASMRSLMMIGFIGSLLAYFFRSLKEAPGEKLHREEYETAREQYAKRTSRRAGNPSKRKRRK
ncbi:tripartite tricarboxylate transporter TctB family protein [Streptomyces aureoverticillatus]|uniref:tripartite tricarboxylate transporter TctB family protein n=1 Tax=Streptomyces aureoverticillatus TaxID=66871 RepID=UPI0013DD6802|nr:tripartite tricarboxylate transporter TctB family protein [Streptomyces aureoverticillatus]QIB44333.1 EamA/RhaT family transporter [Streptomyces aureoverticillatus]